MQPWIIANPQAGKGEGKKVFDKACQILKAAGWEFSPHLTRQPGEAQRLAAQAAAAGSKLVVACGGDGTANEVINGLKGIPTALGIIPAGRGNDLARALGIPHKVETACTTLRRGQRRHIDTVCLGDRLFASVASLGLGAQINHLANQEGGRLSFGPLAYLLPLKQAIKGYDFPWICLEFDKGRYQGEVSLLAVANTPCYGGGLKIAPASRLDDGLLDICVVEKVSQSRLLCNLPLLFWGGHTSKPFVKYFQSKQLRISSPQPLPVFADGEFFQSTPAEFKVNPSSLQVVV